MKTFEEVKSQIEALPHHEYMKLVHWFAERDAESWDKEIEIDAANGNLDFLVEEALDEKRKEKLRQI
ncbi:hypothetical protein [Thiocystis violacea]|uniref:hypothetical protein n=1 Tax=Thiocystis violacea TaxID=13725 RepID=UPI001907DC14|nr:hypothetical protein [Thiocystis violacea]MBK1724272.1 hypothetical protein [Thiocystis violacea]